MASDKKALIMGAGFLLASAASAATWFMLERKRKASASSKPKKPSIPATQVARVLSATLMNVQATFGKAVGLVQKLQMRGDVPNQAIDQHVGEMFATTLGELDETLLAKEKITEADLMYAIKYYEKTNTEVKELSSKIKDILGRLFGPFEEMPEGWTATKFVSMFQDMCFEQIELMGKIVDKAKKEQNTKELTPGVLMVVQQRLKTEFTKHQAETFKRHGLTENTFNMLLQRKFRGNETVARRINEAQAMINTKAKQLGLS